MSEKLDFLTSRKFWALIVVAVLTVLKSQLVLGAEIADPLIALCYGFIGVNIATKVVDKI
jgi:hypothetical protein